MTVREIVVAWLKENGHDGLCTDGCGCGVDDLIPCGDGFASCVPAKLVPVTKAMRESEYGPDIDPDIEEIYVPATDP